MISSKVVFIGARGGSKRTPEKNIRLLGDLPLIVYSIITGHNLGYKTYVSTDSLKIANISEEFGALVIKRPEELSTDISIDIEWIKHALNTLNNKPDLIILLRPTTPIREIEIVKKAINEFDITFDSLRSVQPLQEAIQKAFVINNNLLQPAYPGISLYETSLANQMFQPSYMGNGYVDIVKTDYILKCNDLYGKNIQAFVTPKTIDIDDEDDLILAKHLIEK